MATRQLAILSEREQMLHSQLTEIALEIPRLTEQKQSASQDLAVSLESLGVAQALSSTPNTNSALSRRNRLGNSRRWPIGAARSAGWSNPSGKRKTIWVSFKDGWYSCRSGSRKPARMRRRQTWRAASSYRLWRRPWPRHRRRWQPSGRRDRRA